MANHKSALKRHRQSVKRRASNRADKSSIFTLTKKLISAEGDDKTSVLKAVQSQIAKAARKNILNKKQAAKRVSKLMKMANAK